MESYSRVIRSARESIDCYFASCSQSPEKPMRPSSALRSAFDAAENIYTSEDSLAMQRLRLFSKDEEKPPQQRHLRERREYEKKYLDRLRSARGSSSSSPQKQSSVHGDSRVSLSRQSSKAQSPTLQRAKSLRMRRNSRLHSLMSVCTQARRDTSQEGRREQKCLSNVSVVAKTIQQVDAPCELLEPMYYLRRQSDLSLHTDAVRMKLEQQQSANTSSGQIRLMVLRTAVHRKNSRPR